MRLKNILLAFMVIVFSAFLLSYGESGFNFDYSLIEQLRLPKVLVCILSGGILAIAGLLMQIFFQNPLAGPDILGVSSGSSLFVAFWIMIGSGFPEVLMDWGMSVMSFLGAITVFLILIFFVHKNMNRVSLIIVGLLISSFTSSGISILIDVGQSLQLKNYLIWSMGSFRNVTTPEIPRFTLLALLSLVPVFFFLKPMNQFLLSENYAKSMGVNVKKMRFIFITLSAFQTSVVTLFCGPVGFIGIISPHLARRLLKHSQLNVLLPAVFFTGAILALIAESVLVFIPTSSISVNAILGMIGAPVIVFYLFHQREWGLE